jgi:alpha-galactosidase
LLNNWEATYFDFDENKIDLFKGARYWSRYVLLGDGWFGNKLSRNDDKAGLEMERKREEITPRFRLFSKEAKKRN